MSRAAGPPRKLTPPQVLLVERNRDLAVRQAKKARRSLPYHVQLDDVESWAYHGLIRAALNFDPEVQEDFQAYAISSIRSVILDELRALDWAPRSMRARARQIEAVASELTAQTGRPPTTAAIAQTLGWSETDVTNIAQAEDEAAHIVLSAIDTDDDRRADLISPGMDVGTTAVVGEAMRRMADYIRKLPEPDMTVMLMYYYTELTIPELADELDLHQSRVSSIHTTHVLAIMDMTRELLRT